MSTMENCLESPSEEQSPGRHRLVFEEWLSTNRGYTCDSERAKKIMKYLRNEFDGETPNPQFKFMVKKGEYNIVDNKLFKWGLVNRNGIDERVNLPVIFLEQIFECLYEVPVQIFEHALKFLYRISRSSCPGGISPIWSNYPLGETIQLLQFNPFNYPGMGN